MQTIEPKCAKCGYEHAYEDRELWVCPECSHEWSQSASAATDGMESSDSIRDAHGNALQDGDSVTVIKNLKVKGSTSVVKIGTKVKSIRLVDSNDGHNIACRIDGVGAMNLKSEFVKKS